MACIISLKTLDRHDAAAHLLNKPPAAITHLNTWGRSCAKYQSGVGIPRYYSLALSCSIYKTTVFFTLSGVFHIHIYVSAFALVDWIGLIELAWMHL